MLRMSGIQISSRILIWLFFILNYDDLKHVDLKPQSSNIDFVGSLSMFWSWDWKAFGLMLKSKLDKRCTASAYA